MYKLEKQTGISNNSICLYSEVVPIINNFVLLFVGIFDIITKIVCKIEFENLLPTAVYYINLYMLSMTIHAFVVLYASSNILFIICIFDAYVCDTNIYGEIIFIYGKLQCFAKFTANDVFPVPDGPYSNTLFICEYDAY
jgi:hypothetical protein